MKKFMLFNAVALTLSLNSWAIDPVAEEARRIRVVLETYLEPGPTKVVANDICSAQGPKFNAYFKNEVFNFSEIQDSTSKSTHTTQISYKKSFAKETVKVGDSRQTEDETHSFALSDGVKEAPVDGAKTSINMIDQFVDKQVKPQRDDKSALQKSDLPSLKTELEEAWKFLKRVGACCAEKKCKSALQAQISISQKLGHRPNPASPAPAAQ